MNRDTVDERIIDDVIDGEGSVKTDHSVTWPEYASGTAYDDTDNDGMGDQWEYDTFGDLTTARYDSNTKTDQDGDGYYDLEEFLNGTTAGEPAEPPTVAFTQPTETVVTEPADLGVVAEATAPGGSIDNVKLYLNGTLVRQENEAPYQWGTANTTTADSALLGLTAGTYTLRVVATDARGASAADTMTVTVEPGAVRVRGNALPPTPVSTDHGPRVFDLQGKRMVKAAASGMRRGDFHATGSSGRGVLIVRSDRNTAPNTRIVVLDQAR